MSITQDEILRRFLEEPGGHVVLNPDLRIVDVGPEYVRLTHSQRDNLIGKLYLTTITDPDPDRRAVVLHVLGQSLAEVSKTLIPNKLSVFRSDIVDSQDAHHEERWWRMAHIPLAAEEDGKLEYIVIRLEDVSVVQVTNRAIQAQRISNYITYAAVILLMGVLAVAFTFSNSRTNKALRQSCQLQSSGLTAQRHLRNVMKDIQILITVPQAPGQPKPNPKAVSTAISLNGELQSYLDITGTEPPSRKC